MSEPKQVSLLVTGDFVLDHHIYEGQRHHFGDHKHRGVQAIEELGGAALIHYLLCALGGGVVSHLSVAVDENRIPRLSGGARIPDEVCAYAIWKPFARGSDESAEDRVWRTENAMGFGGEAAEGKRVAWPSAPDMPVEPDIVVLSDGGMGFRDNKSSWPEKALAKARWIVLKTAGPLTEGALWNLLTQPPYREKLVVVVSSNELRKSPVRIGAGLSWDDTVESTLEALKPNGELAALTLCRHLLLAFGSEGGLWLDYGGRPEGPRAHLVYDAKAIEGEHWPEGRGKAFGALSCLTATVAWHLARAGEHPDLATALDGGLSAMYDLFDQGHGRSAVKGAGFPVARLAKAVTEASCRYSRTAFTINRVSATPVCALQPLPAPELGCWSILLEVLRQQGSPCPAPAWDLAERIAVHGPIAIQSLPHLAIGKLMSVDRREIESLRVLRRLILAYKNREDCKKPLSIGIFGPPGAGKTFSVKQIALELVGKEWLEFNLSQFKSGTEDLIGAFHQVRDRGLKGELPVAFFDEFDSRDYVWLQYLLAPMNEGAFQEGQITHPIGKCIFIFAGGTSRTYGSFGPPEGDADAYAKFRMAKGPDFKSRLDGFLDVMGPNPRKLLSATPDPKSQAPLLVDPCDIFYPVRRAFMIRSEFGCEDNEKLAIDHGLLHALLRIDEYIHGSRSLGKIIESLKAARPGRVNRSLMPPRQQLALYVDANQFLEASRQPRTAPAPGGWNDATRAIVAEAIHNTYNRLGVDQGWMKPEDCRAFSELDDFDRNSNLAAADRMPQTLALIELALMPGDQSDDEWEAIRLKLEYNLELLAAAEHDGWMEWHLHQGWQWAPGKKNKKARTHPCLKPYIQLSSEERNKDRDSIRHFPEFARTAGMKIVTLGICDED